jgi:hypothetical protein
MVIPLWRRTESRMFRAVLCLGAEFLGAALLLALGDVRPTSAQFFDFFQRPPGSYGYGYQRQQPRAPQQGYGYGWGWGWGGQPEYQRPDLYRPPARPRTYQPRSTYAPPTSAPPRRAAPRYIEPRQVEPRHVEPRHVEPRQAQQEDFTKAPPPRNPDGEPRKKVVILGDSMADWLAYGLEDALADSSDDLGVVRKHRTRSGLIRNEPQDYDWAQGAHDVLANQKADFIVIMIGQSDRHAIREPAPSKTSPSGAQKSGGTPRKPGDTAHAPSETAKPAESPEDSEDSVEAQKKSTDRATTGLAVDGPQPETERTGPSLTHQFRSEKWAELYAKRIDQVIAVLKRKNAPVLWVGLPPIRGSRSGPEMTYLNDLFKARAEKAGIIYVDVWDGFANDDGDYTTYGPDAAGQVRRLRTADGVHFTKAGARKLSHYIEREIRRLLSRETPVALPVPQEPQKPTGAGQPKGPAPRPIAGPVVPLTGQQPRGERALLGGPEVFEPLAAKVLMKGEALDSTKGRADDFSWPAASASGSDIIDHTEPVAASRPTPSIRRATGPKGGQKKAERPDQSQSRQADSQRSSGRSR